MKRAAILIFLLITSLAAACYWDYDTLSEEAKGKLNVVDAIVGRVRRFPPIYYEKRIEIAIPKAKQGDFDAYDSIAVAYSRLGKQDEAIKWIQTKRTAMKANPSAVTKDIEYRTESNEGTFWLVKWLSVAEGQGKREWLFKSQSQITRALKIDPNAHFGREQVQLDYIEWLLSDSHASGFGTYKIANPHQPTPAKRREGLVGLITLGAAWENPDIIGAVPGIGDRDSNDSSFIYLANLRISELINKPVPANTNGRPWAGSTWQSFREDNLKANYKSLRENAKQYQATFASFVTNQVNQGLHPDKDGERFWIGYVPTQRIEFVDPPFSIGIFFARNPYWGMAILLSFLVGSLIASFFTFRWLIRKLARRRQRAS